MKPSRLPPRGRLPRGVMSSTVSRQRHSAHGVLFMPSPLEHAVVVMGEVRTRRWDDPALPDDGARLLVTRYRPRGVRAADETWHEWWKELAPSVALHAAAYGKHGEPPLDDDTYRRHFLDEMTGERARFALRALANRVAAGETITLLCSSACSDEARCHRSVLRELVLALVDRGARRGR